MLYSLRSVLPRHYNPVSYVSRLGKNTHIKTRYQFCRNATKKSLVKPLFKIRRKISNAKKQTLCSRKYNLIYNSSKKLRTKLVKRNSTVP